MSRVAPEASKETRTAHGVPPPIRPRIPHQPVAMDKDEAQEYLQSLLNKNLRVTATDGRLFWGAFKCTDPVRQARARRPAAR